METTIPKPPLTYGFGHGEEMFYLEVLDEIIFDDFLKEPTEKRKENNNIKKEGSKGVSPPEGRGGNYVPLGDYGQILDNFIVPTANIEYVYHTIIQGFKKMGYEKEYKVACAALLQSANEHWIQLEPAIYAELVQA